MGSSYTKFRDRVAPFYGLTGRPLSGHIGPALTGMPPANLEARGERDAQQDTSADNPGVVHIDFGLRRRNQRLERESRVNCDGTATSAATGGAGHGDSAC